MSDLSMEELVSLLVELEKKDSLPDNSEYVLLWSDDPIIRAIQICASEILTSNHEGRFLFNEMDNLYKWYGYFVRPGGFDEDGMEFAYIQTKKGLISFW